MKGIAIIILFLAMLAYVMHEVWQCEEEEQKENDLREKAEKAKRLADEQEQRKIEKKNHIEEMERNLLDL